MLKCDSVRHFYVEIVQMNINEMVFAKDDNIEIE